MTGTIVANRRLPPGGTPARAKLDQRNAKMLAERWRDIAARRPVPSGPIGPILMPKRCPKHSLRHQKPFNLTITD